MLLCRGRGSCIYEVHVRCRITTTATDFGFPAAAAWKIPLRSWSSQQGYQPRWRVNARAKGPKRPKDIIIVIGGSERSMSLDYFIIVP